MSRMVSIPSCHPMFSDRWPKLVRVPDPLPKLPSPEDMGWYADLPSELENIPWGDPDPHWWVKNL